MTGHFSGPQKKKATLGPGLSFPVFDGRSGARVAGGGRGERKFEKRPSEPCRIRIDVYIPVLVLIPIETLCAKWYFRAQETRCNHSVTWIWGECRLGL